MDVEPGPKAEDSAKGPADHGAAKWLEREEAHSRQVMSTAKVVATFSAAIAATFVATALQSGDPTPCDWVAAGFMLVTVAVTVWIVVLPRKSDVELGHLKGKSAEVVQSKLVAAATDDAERARFMYWLMVGQVGLSLLTSVVSCIGLLLAVGTKP